MSWWWWQRWWDLQIWDAAMDMDVFIEPCRQWHRSHYKTNSTFILFGNASTDTNATEKGAEEKIWENKEKTHKHTQQQQQEPQLKILYFGKFYSEFFLPPWFGLVWFWSENCRSAKWNKVKLKFYSYTPCACVRVYGVYWRIHWIYILPEIPKDNCIAASNNASHNSNNNNIIVHFLSLEDLFHSHSVDGFGGIGIILMLLRKSGARMFLSFLAFCSTCVHASNPAIRDILP